MSTTQLVRPSRRARSVRPTARLRYAAGRHRTSWRVVSAIAALVLAFALSPKPAERQPVSTTQATETSGSLFNVDAPGLPAAGAVGVALPLTAAFPQLEAGSIVHAVAVNDPLVSGETRSAAIIVRESQVLEVGESAVTIEVAEEDAVRIVEAMTLGSVVLVTAVP